MTLNHETPYDCVVVGSGITGLAAAIGFLRRGVTNILVLEKSVTLYPVGASIAIFSNGLRALEYISPTVAVKVRESAIPIENMIVKDLKDQVIREKKPPSDSTVSYMVWYLLQQYLAQELPDGMLQLGSSLESFQVDDSDDGLVTLTIFNRATSETSSIQTRVLVGTDGINSRIRKQLFGKDTTSTFYHGKVMYRAVLPVSDVTNPPPTGINMTFQGDNTGILFSYRETSPGILTVTAMDRFDEELTVNDLSISQKKDEMCLVFQDFPDEVQRVLEQLEPTSIHRQAIHDIDVLEGAWSKGPVIVIGDAAHAMSPAMGQGANQGLEDAAVLVHMLSEELASNATNDTQHDHDATTKASISLLLEKVYQCRIERVKAIHAASRARSISNNESSSSKPIDMTSAELKRILEVIDSWTAPVDDES